VTGFVLDNLILWCARRRSGRAARG